MYKLVNLSKTYNSNNKIIKALDNINLEIKENEFVMISGSNGSGKSTLLNVLSGVDNYQDGEMYFENNKTSYYDEQDYEDFRNKYITFVYQEYNLIESYTCYQNIEIALIAKNIKYTHDDIISYLKEVRLEDKEKIKASNLSGGQKARLAIARSLASNAKILIMDEPTGALDPKASEEIVDILKKIKGSKTIIVVTHNEELFKELANHHITIHNGHIIEDKLTSESIKREEKKVVTVNKNKKASKIASLNIKNKHGRSLLSFTLSLILTIFIVVGFSLITYMNSEKEIATNYQNSYNRIILNKETGLQESDYQKFKNDDAIIINESNLLDKNLTLKVNNLKTIKAPILNSSLIKDNDLELGKLPKNNDEIVIPYNKNLVKMMDEYLNKYTNFKFDLRTNRTYYFYEAKIVGMAKTPYYYLPNTKDLNTIVNEFDSFEMEDSLYCEDIYISYNYDNDKLYCSKGMDEHPEINGTTIDATIDSSASYRGYKFNPTFFVSKCDTKNYPITLIVNDASKYVDSLDGYDFYIPNFKETLDEEALKATTVYTICLGVALLLVIFGFGVISSLIYTTNSRKDYAILNALGYKKETIKNSINLELLFNYSISLLLMIIVILLDYFTHIFKGIFTYNGIISYLLMFISILIVIYNTSDKVYKRLKNNSLFTNLRGGDNNA